MLWNRSLIKPEFYVGSDEPYNEEVVRERFAAKAKRYLGQLPLAFETVAMYFCLLDSRTPIWVKATVAAALAYFILPLDAVPDLLPIVGLSDDASVIAAALTAVAAPITSARPRGPPPPRASRQGAGLDGRRDRAPGRAVAGQLTTGRPRSRPAV